MRRDIVGLAGASLLFAMSFSACKSSSSAAGDSACTTYGKALISYEGRCAGTVDPARRNALLGRYTQLCQSTLDLPGVASGTAATLSSCAAAIQAADCNTSFDQLDACSDISAGALADGSPCADGVQCQSGSCSGSRAGNGATSACGTCQPALADGAACDQGGACVVGDACVATLGDGGVATAVCVKKPALADVGSSCTASSDCKAPNHCAFSGGTATGTCTASVGSGGSCAESTDCGSGLICTGGASRTCNPPLAPGAVCNGGDCGVGYACDATLTCVAVVFVPPGGTCDGDEKFCSQGTCPIADDGTNPDPTGTCPTIIADGQSCDAASTAAQCDTFATCTEGKCALVAATCN